MIFAMASGLSAAKVCCGVNQKNTAVMIFSLRGSRKEQSRKSVHSAFRFDLSPSFWTLRCTSNCGR